MCLADLCPAIFEWCWVDLHLEFVVEFSQVTWHLACIIKLFSANSHSRVFNLTYFYRLKSKPVEVSLFSQLGEAQNSLSEFEWVYAESLNKWDILVSFYSGLLNNRFDDLCADGLPVLNKDMIDTLVVIMFFLYPLPSFTGIAFEWVIYLHIFTKNGGRKEEKKGFLMGSLCFVPAVSEWPFVICGITRFMSLYDV